MNSSFIFLNAVIQSAGQSLFLVFYFRSGHRFRKWIILVSVFILIFLINQSLMLNNLLLKNIFNILALALTCHLLFGNESWKTIFTGVLLYELLLLSTEFICVSLSYFLFGMPPDVSPESPGLPLWYACSDSVIFLLVPIMLQVFPRGLTYSERINVLLIPLLLNVVLIAGLWCMVSVPGYFERYGIDYIPQFIILTILNIYNVISLIVFIRKESRIQATALIESAYESQIEAYLQMEEQEENLHRLRHDLINFAQSSGPSSDSSIAHEQKNN